MGLASLLPAFHSASTAAGFPSLFVATDKLGRPLDPSRLQSFKDGSGLMGSFRDAATGFGQARFHAVDGGAAQTVAVVPYDPTMLLVAAVLVQVNQKLDSIQSAVDEMFEHMRDRDKAQLRGNVIALQGYLSEYGFNWDNDIWLSNSHKEAMEIKRESEQAVVHLRSQIRRKLHGKRSVEGRVAVKGRLEEVLDRLKEYQLAVYAYAFSSFLEPLMSGNCDEAYLSSIIERIRDQGNGYRELYTECYNAIELSAGRSVDTAVLGGFGAVLGGFGDLVERTPVGDLTSLDEAISGAGERVQRFNDGLSSGLIEKLHQAKAPDLLPFIKTLCAVSRFCNHPYQVAVDADALYFLPEGETLANASSS